MCCFTDTLSGAVLDNVTAVAEAVVEAELASGPVGSQVAFALLSIIVIVAAWRTVTSPSLMRSALALVVVLGGLAPVFLLVGAEFLAVVQLLVYVGAVVVLFLFGIMLTRSPMEPSDRFDHRFRWPGLLGAVLVFAGLWTAIRDMFGSERVDPGMPSRTSEVGNVLMRQHVLAFEAVSMLLLVALIGAVVIARRD